ncbi:hypothetical protein WJX73_009405 [Symbiochloris irregularis]|uniref:F-box domain-containing protein n=1 Tax=Symbiochloris irregularis TaxID=706552 RepID=A0AAW1P8B8_9CHLO
MEALLASSLTWQDVFGLHICTKLRVADLHALHTTCRAFRQLIATCLPASTWQAVATNTLPVTHPLLPLPGSEVRGCLERIARAKGVKAVPRRLGLWKQESRQADFAINHQGTQVIVSRGLDVGVYRLQLSHKRLSKRTIWSGSWDLEDDNLLEVKFTWSKADNYVALRCFLRDVEGSPFELVHLYNTRTESLQGLGQADLPLEADEFHQPAFSSCENKLILPWKVAGSPDGIFLAVIVQRAAPQVTLEHFELQILEFATGRLLHTYHAREWLSAVFINPRPETWGNVIDPAELRFDLQWAGLRLFVGFSFESFDGFDSDEETNQTLFVFPF